MSDRHARYSCAIVRFPVRLICGITLMEQFVTFNKVMHDLIPSYVVMQKRRVGAQPDARRKWVRGI